MFISEDAGCCRCCAGPMRSCVQVLRRLLMKMLGVANVVWYLEELGVGAAKKSEDT